MPRRAKRRLTRKENSSSSCWACAKHDVLPNTAAEVTEALASIRWSANCFQMTQPAALKRGFNPGERLLFRLSRIKPQGIKLSCRILARGAVYLLPHREVGGDCRLSVFEQPRLGSDIQC